MKRLIFLLVFAILFACNDNDVKYTKAENGLDAAREFIDALLKGDSQRARAYMIDDEENNAILSRLHRQLRARSTDDREGYKDASIMIGDTENLSETEMVIHYKSSYDRIARKVKVINIQGEWKVDLKYTLDPNL
ncbi:MAG: hypothetical protein K0Q66_88 [Chitinophagaceae bacterium]|jgi:hypothetical protein|nr:hypothetical protein [Chitinophagaceae bacterium]